MLDKTRGVLVTEKSYIRFQPWEGRNFAMDPAAALKAIDDLDKFGINLGLSRIGSCLAALGNPQDALLTIHVGGTNGKGSTSAFTAEILRAAGYRVGLYTSPPLNFFGERIRVDGAMLPDEAVPALLERVLAAAKTFPEGAGMTQFEIITAMAFLHFADVKVDYAVIEVGLGGRLDSTNVITPLASAVTNVGLEHSAHLGTTVEAIAAEKAGIIKPCAVFSTTAEEPARSVLRAKAAEVGAPFKALGEDYDLTAGEGGYTFAGAKQRVEGIVIGLPGPFQRLNLALALSLVEEILPPGHDFAQVAREGALNAKWPGRLELFEARGVRVLIDGAHNPHAAKALAEALAIGFPRRKLNLVLGILDDKDAQSIMGYLAPLADEVILTRSTSRRALAPGELLELARGVLEGAHAAPDVGSAIEAALKISDPEDLIVVTGSLTLVGEARARLTGGGF